MVSQVRVAPPGGDGLAIPVGYADMSERRHHRAICTQMGRGRRARVAAGRWRQVLIGKDMRVSGLFIRVLLARMKRSGVRESPSPECPGSHFVPSGLHSLSTATPMKVMWEL